MKDSSRAAQARYREFVEAVTVSGQVWGLKSEVGWACCDSGLKSGATVLPFWSDRSVAEASAQANLAGYEPVPIPLDLFVVRWLTNMATEGAMVGPDWEPTTLSGFEVDPAAMRKRIMKLLGLA